MATPEQISVPISPPHSWTISTVSDHRHRIVAVAICAICGRIRTEVVDATGAKVNRLDLTGECR